MERILQGKLISTRSNDRSESVVFGCSEIRKNHRETMRIFSNERSNLATMLAKLPDLFLQKECSTIKSEKKIIVARMPLEVSGKVRPVYVKQHSPLSFACRLSSLFSPSAAMRSLRGAAILLRQGYATALPVAAVEYRSRGVLIKSLYISEEISGAHTADGFWRDCLAALEGAAGYVKRRAFLGGLARLFRSLHDGSIYHNDLKSSNILVLAGRPFNEATFRLIDLQGLKKCFFVSRRRRIKNLAQLNRTLGIYLTRTEKLTFLRAYGEYQFLNRRSRRNLVRRILEQTRQQILREQSRHQAPETFIQVVSAEAETREEEDVTTSALRQGALSQMISQQQRIPPA